MVRFTSRAALLGLIGLLCSFFRSLSAQEHSVTMEKAFQVLYQHNYISAGKSGRPECDTTELILTIRGSRYGAWRRDELFAELKAEQAGVLATQPKSVVTLMSIEMLRPTLEKAGIDTQLKHLRPWFVPRDTELIYKGLGSDSLSFADELPKDGIITYSKPRPQFDWVEELTMSIETEQILGYNCRKASTVIDGQTWTAWYCEDLPFDNGPAGFSDLPGLILRLSNSAGIEYQAIGFKQTQVSPELVSLPSKAKALKERDYQDLRASDRNNRRYYLLGADGNIYFIYMDKSEYATLLEQEL